ncbi:MAG: cytochrome ubiquinol oxidase subunit I [Chloroflexi bacterium]|nr:cytochrome ubiquinol oxidase subunit I [Chloroflexota bacterium]
MMPEFTLSIPVVGNTWTVGLAFQVHIVIVAFIMGIAILAPTAEWLGLRSGGESWERLAHDLGETIGRLFAFGATWAVFALMLIFGLYPRLFGVLTGIFFWPLVAVGAIWFVMTISAYLYYVTWERLDQRRGLHLAIGWTFAGSAFLFITLITELSSFQLTPSDPSRLLAAALNPSWPTEIVHRHIGNVSYAGLLLASYASARALFPPQRNELDRAHYDWLADVALLLGISMALFQPLVGWFYARQVQIASPGAYERMMIGANSWMFLVQGFFFGAVLFLGNVYMALSIRRGKPGKWTVTWMRNSAWAIGILALLLIVPKGWPLGQMMPWKYISLFGLVLFSLVNVALYRRVRRDFAWGSGGRELQVAMAIVGIAIVALMVTMGIIRTSARGSYVIYGQMGPGEVQQIERP